MIKNTEKSVLDHLISDFDTSFIDEMTGDECRGFLRGFIIGSKIIPTLKDALREEMNESNKVHKQSKMTPIYSPEFSLYARARQAYVGKLIFKTLLDAENVLNKMINTVELDGFASLHRLCTLSGIPVKDWMEDWGWRDLSDAKIEKTFSGYDEDDYTLIMPEIEEVNQNDIHTDRRRDQEKDYNSCL